MSGLFGATLISKFSGEVPIMSFQTNKNGTFNPTMPVASGTLKWIIDGEEQITNTPSKVLIGDIVDVEVFANDVPEGVVLTAPTFNSQNIIGEYSLEYFLINGIVNASTNLLMTSLPYSVFANVSSGVALINTGVTIQNFSNVLITGSSSMNDSELTSVIFKNQSQSFGTLRLQNNNLASLDLSNIIFTGGLLELQGNPLTTLILNNVDAQSLSTINLANNEITSLNLNTYTVESEIRGFLLQNLVNYTPPTDYGLGLTLNAVQTAALNQTSVNLFYTAMDTWYSANVPTANLLAATNLGTSASPNGAGLAALVNLRDVVYPNAGFTFTPLTN